MAEARMLEQVFEKKPVLLLDDVFSELDEDRRRKVLSLCDFGHQILITSTDRLEGMRVGSQAYRVGGGAVEAVKGEARL
jgi:DNA replication and repair protein RecF